MQLVFCRDNWVLVKIHFNKIAMAKNKNKFGIDEELKKYITNLKRAARRKQNKQFMSRLQKYHAYYIVLSNLERNKMAEIFELLENEQTVYLSPITLWYLGCFDKSWHAHMQNLIFDVDLVIREVVNESLLHALRILIDRTALFAHVLYPTFDKGKGFGNIGGNKRGGFIDFVSQELKKPAGELSRYNEKEMCFFRYVKEEYDNWIHEFLQADNKVKHNGSLRPLYDISKPIIVAPDAYELRNRNQQRTATLEITDWEQVMNKAYAFFDRVFEHVTATI